MVVRSSSAGCSTNLAHSIKSIQELIALDIRFLAVTQNIDTDESNPMSPFMRHIFAAFAELEREMIRERVTSGIRRAKANRKQLGRPKRVFRRDLALSMPEAGMSWRKILLRWKCQWRPLSTRARA